ncbi:SRPBCC domain-containing protein [Yoonia sp.]|jgi:uncharacterized protein YndB with AHSA1/START domain|uniref:SRPBCC domain-containing protein n=1 Tax=Yoonia sp. TaxID=2212373 RepID=UPI0025E5BA5F|nr:SRPBCC domain-containing protein [Yoonia sp.]
MTDTALSFTRDLAATPMNVWRCWTDAALLEQWFAPKPVVVTDALIAPFPGGQFNSTMHIPGVPKPVVGHGCVLVAEPGRRFAFTNMMTGGFQPADTTGPGQFPFTAEILIAARDTGCTYTAIVRHLTAQAAQAHREMGFFDGWGTATDQLDALAVTLPSDA